MNQIISILPGLLNEKKIKPKNTGSFGNSVNSSNSLSPIEQQIFDELSEIESKGKFDSWNVNNLRLLTKISSVKNTIDKFVLKKVKWYLKTLLALNLSSEEIMIFLKLNLMDLLDNQELEYGRSLESPFLVGFNRDENGKIFPIYGNRLFRSERNIDTSSMIISPDPRKEVSLIPGAIKQVSNMEIRKIGFWDLLPEDLRNIFENGAVLQTTGDDFYDINGPYQKGAFSCETQAETLAEIDENIQIGALKKQMYNGISNYMLLYYGMYLDNTNGRTGVLVEMRNGKLEPVKVEIDGVEYIVEIKGCGLRSGGFGEMQSRTGREILSGGVEKDQAVEEFEVLESISNGNGPKVAGIALFNNSGYEQGQIIRLSPSTLRASYTGNNCYDDIEQPGNVEKILDMYVKGFIEMLFSNSPRIISRSSHSENLLIWGNGNFCWTDYSDQLFLNSNRLPFKAEVGGFLTVKKLLFFVIEMKKEIPGYSEKFRGVFVSNLIKYFNENGIQLEITEKSSDEEITNEIWKKVLAYITFKQKLIFGFNPEKIEKDFENEKIEFLGKYESMKEFEEEIKGLALKMQINLENYLSVNNNDLKKENLEKIQEILGYMRSGNYKVILNKNYLEDIYKYFLGVDFNVIRVIIDLFNKGFDFNNLILFLESEIDMFENAFSQATEEEKEVIQRGLDFYRLRLEYIKKVNNFELPLEEIFEFMGNARFEDLIFDYK